MDLRDGVRHGAQCLTSMFDDGPAGVFGRNFFILLVMLLGALSDAMWTVLACFLSLTADATRLTPAPRFSSFWLSCSSGLSSDTVEDELEVHSRQSERYRVT